MIKNRVLASAGYGTHITPLMAAVLATTGDVVELGMGDYSTPLIHEIIKHQRDSGIKRKLFSFENNTEWLNNFIDLKTTWHKIASVVNWNDITLEINLSVLFIDHAPAERRVVDIIKYKENAKIIVVHDTEKANYYGYSKAFSQFQYKFVYERYRKQTTLLSNYIDVTKIL